MSLFTIMSVLCALGAGLTAGIFYAFSTFVMAALAKLPPANGIAAMNAINVAVINPWFMAVFLGTPLLCLAVMILAVLNWSTPGSAWILAAAVLYIAGSFGVTVFFNVPLNNALGAQKPSSPEAAALWTRYLTDWTLWNHVRTAAPFAAMAMFIVGLLLQKNVAP